MCIYLLFVDDDGYSSERNDGGWELLYQYDVMLLYCTMVCSCRFEKGWRFVWEMCDWIVLGEKCGLLRSKCLYEWRTKSGWINPS